MQQHPKHDEDFYSWAMATATLLKNKQYQEVDMDSVIEELESMGRGEKRELVSCLAQLMLHLLKWQYQPTFRGVSWKISILKQRMQLPRILKQNPSLKSFLNEAIVEAFNDSKKLAIEETGLDKRTFPFQCPYTIEQMLDEEFLPEEKSC